MQQTMLFPQRICETMSGNLAYTVGRLAFRRGRPMLVEHVGGIYLEHDLSGKVLTDGYGTEFDLVHVRDEDSFALASHAIINNKQEVVNVDAGNGIAGILRGDFSNGA
jgi:hypothetical protein